VTYLERLRWNDEEMDGKIFLDWKKVVSEKGGTDTRELALK
jgi:hypothetical protein